MHLKGTFNSFFRIQAEDNLHLFVGDENVSPEKYENCDASGNLELEVKRVSLATDIHESDVENNSDTDSDEEYLPPNKYRKKTERKKKVIMTPLLSSALDRCNVENRDAVYVLAAAAKSMGQNPENMVINRESFRKSRNVHRQQKATQILERFDPSTPLVLHWDGKMMPNAELNQKVDRIAIVVTGDGVSQHLATPYLVQSDAEKQAELVFKIVKKWKLLDKIQFLSFDTTNLNSGRLGGICLLLQRRFGKY